jgi:ribosomal protein S18 acetylase RimI-like enzyme
MVTIRPARPEDAGVVAALRAQSWQAAYAGVIPDDVLAESTSPASVARQATWFLDRWTGMIIAESDGAAVGYSSFGRERTSGELGSMPGPDQDPARAELYAIYVAPAHWSTGAGRALMDSVLDRAAAAGYERISLWVLRDNPRARRFYGRAGFSVTGESEVLAGLGGVTEVRYARPLSRTGPVVTGPVVTGPVRTGAGRTGAGRTGGRAGRLARRWRGWPAIRRAAGRT